MVLGWRCLPAPIQHELDLPGTPLPLVFLGGVLMLFTPLVAGGALFRIVSAPRAIQLLPHARWRLLAGIFGVVMLGTLLWIFAYWAAFQHAPLQLRPRADGYLMMYVLTLSFATQGLDQHFCRQPGTAGGVDRHRRLAGAGHGDAACRPGGCSPGH